MTWRAIPASLFVLFLLSLCFESCIAVYAPYIQPSWYFNYNEGIDPQFTVTEQCQQINVTWTRQPATGPFPVPPYYLQVYSSRHLTPFVIPAGEGPNFMWTVPFAPGTVYEICMFDQGGNAAGCQDTYTVIAPYNSTTTPSCQNVTDPPQLNVDATVSNGPLSRYGFIDECTDISIKPMSGTPPFKLTIAPALHALINITSDDMKAINWTVALSWGAPFFISLVDADGNSWANGPLHSGIGQSIACLAGTVAEKSPVLEIVIGVAASVGGLMIGGLFASLYYRDKSKRYPRQSTSHLPYVNLNMTANDQSSVPVNPYNIRPFDLSPEDLACNAGSPSPASDPQAQQVYVLHPDIEHPPVTVIASAGAHVVDLPWGYSGIQSLVSRRSLNDEPMPRGSLEHETELLKQSS